MRTAPSFACCCHDKFKSERRHHLLVAQAKFVEMASICIGCTLGGEHFGIERFNVDYGFALWPAAD